MFQKKNNENKTYYYLLNGGSTLKGVKTKILSTYKVASPSAFQLVDATHEPAYISLGVWTITTPDLYCIASNKQIEGFDGNIMELPDPIVDVKYEHGSKIFFIYF